MPPLNSSACSEKAQASYQIAGAAEQVANVVPVARALIAGIRG